MFSDSEFYLKNKIKLLEYRLKQKSSLITRIAKAADEISSPQVAEFVGNIKNVIQKCRVRVLYYYIIGLFNVFKPLGCKILLAIMYSLRAKKKLLIKKCVGNVNFTGESVANAG